MGNAVTPDGLSRRELLGSLARWTVPTVVTITLGSRSLLAWAPSCPPCTKRTAGKCRSCSVSQILNCQCEPCLGAPYCSTPTSPSLMGAPGGGAAPGGAAPGGAPDFSMPQLGGGTVTDPRIMGRAPASGLRGYSSPDPLSAPLYRDPFTTTPRYRPLGGEERSLYGRLRGDTITMRRRP